jgi:tRNA A-37 threonylcarbamoyl transferase component Bud32
MSGMACGAGMSMSMNMNDDDASVKANNKNSNKNLNEPSLVNDTTLLPQQANTLQAAAAQQQAQLLQKAIGATRTDSSTTTVSSGSATNSMMQAAAAAHKPPRGGQNPLYNPGIPPSRSGGSVGPHSLYKPSKPMTSAGSFDHDHQTFATATTASATISYSTDEVEHTNSEVSEAGMEVIMDTDSEERCREEQILSLVNRTNNKQPRLSKPKEEPYKSHTFSAGKHTFTVDTRYSFIRVIGSGAYGVVISAKDTKAESEVAIKMVPRAFHDEIDAKRILREIKLLKHFEHENIVGILDMMPPAVKHVEDFNDVYIVTDLMETDLHRIIYSKQKLSMDHVQYFVYQVLRGLKYIHSCNVLHRDLKPSNLLVNSNCDLKICDFGLARGIVDDPMMEESNKSTLLLTEYVVTRWYRAPEIMLACHEYSKPIDVWSVGCIFAELILRKPYFPGDDYIDQVRRLFSSNAP